MITPTYIVGFSGNRPSDAPGRSLSEIESLRASLEETFSEIQQKLDSFGGRFEFFSSAAEGADVIACEIAIEKGIPVHVILPKPLNLFKNDFNDSDQDAWNRTLRVIEHAEAGKDGASLRVAQIGSDDELCYQSVNADILEASDIIVFLWNGESTQKEGGTGEFIEQAKAYKIPFIALNTTDQDNPIRFNFEAISYESFDKNGLTVIEDLEKETEKHSNKKSGSFQKVWENVERAANSSSKWFRLSMTLSILFHGCGAIIAGFAVSYAFTLSKGMMALLSGIELLLVGVALILMLWHSAKRTQHKWIEHRFASELMRGFQVCAGIVDPLAPRIRSHAPVWHRFALSSLLMAHRDSLKTSSDVEELKKNYIRDRIDDQIGYFNTQYRKAKPRSHFFHVLGHFTSWFALIAVTAALLYKGMSWIEEMRGHKAHHHEGIIELLLIFVVYFLPVALPLIAGISNSLSTSLDVSRRKLRYLKMVQLLEQQRDYIKTIKNIYILRRTVVKLEEILLDELLEWKASAELGQGH